MSMVKLSYFSLALATLLATSSASALEVSAGSSDLQNVTSGFDARLNASNAALTTAINQILTCNNRGMIFASNPSAPGRDADGCISAEVADLPEMTVATETVTKNLPDLTFVGGTSTSPGDYTVNYGGAGWGGETGYKTISIQPFLDDGASGNITFTAVSSNFVHGVCNGQTRSITINPTQSSNSASQPFYCHYDSNPNRVHAIKYQYNAATKRIGFMSAIWQGNSLPTSKLVNFTVTYSASRVVPAGAASGSNQGWQ